MKAIITIGVSASGKSTWATEYAAKNNFVNINRDDIRFDMFCGGVRDWSLYKFNNKNEQKVTEAQNEAIEKAAHSGKSIIVSDTNLNKSHRNKLISKLKHLGFEVDIAEFPITFEEACKRDSLRSNGVGHSTIARQFEQWKEFCWEYGAYKYVADTTKPKAILVDIDGTLAHMQGRGAFEWDKVGTDSVDDMVATIVRSLCYSGIKVVLMSGRDSVCRDITEEWLSRNDLHFYEDLFMRAEGDMRKDTIVKRELFVSNVKDHYNVIGAIDDRPSVCRMWESIGIKVMRVGNPYIEF